MKILNLLQRTETESKEPLQTPQTAEDLMENLSKEKTMSDLERKEKRQEVIKTFWNGNFSGKDVDYLIKIYGLEDTQIIWWAIYDIYFPIFERDKRFKKERIHYFDNLTHDKIKLLKNKDTTKKLWEFVWEHRKKTNSILTVRRIMHDWKDLMDQYCEKDWEDKREQKKEEERIKVEEQKAKKEQTRLAKEERQKTLATLADSRKSYETADKQTQQTMIDRRTANFNSNIDKRLYPSDSFWKEQIEQIISTYGADNMQKLLDIIKNVYMQDMPYLSGKRKTEALMDQILSQTELDTIDQNTMSIFKQIIEKTHEDYPLKALVKDCTILCKTLNINNKQS